MQVLHVHPLGETPKYRYGIGKPRIKIRAERDD